MKKCYRCGSPWHGHNQNPRSRDVCDGCGANLHSCYNCLHFDRLRAHSCKLKDATYVGSRSAPNYCEQFSMADTVTVETKARVEKAKDRWEALFRR